MFTRTIGHRVLAAGAAALVAGVLAACSSGSASTPTTATGLSGQTITVYSGQHEQTTEALVADFTTRTGIEVKLKSNDEASLAGQLLQEGSASPADVFYAENPPALTGVQAKHLLAPVDAATLAQVPRTVSSAQGDWVAVSARTAAFAAHSTVGTGQLPQSVYDLAAPAWKGKLGIAPAETDFSPIVTEIINARGTDAAKTWLQGLKAKSKVYEDNETLIAAIDKGEVQGGIVDHYYWYRLRDEVGATKVRSVLHYFRTGDPGALVDVSGAAVLASSRHKQAAQAFHAYLVGAPAQTIIATSKSYEYPLRPGILSTTNLKPLAAVGSTASPASLGDGSAALNLLQTVGLL